MKLSSKTLAMDVLVVDDEPISRQMAAQTLESAGYCVHQASNGREALEIVLASSIELIVCDWSMPEMDGLELCRHLRSGTVDRYIYMITSKRSYKAAIAPEQARSLIVLDSGTHFDPRVVASFLAMEDEFREIHMSHPPIAFPNVEKRTAQLMSV